MIYFVGVITGFTIVRIVFPIGYIRPLSPHNPHRGFFFCPTDIARSVQPMPSLLSTHIILCMIELCDKDEHWVVEKKSSEMKQKPSRWFITSKVSLYGKWYVKTGLRFAPVGFFA